MAYQLAFTLHAHSSDVRNLCVPSPGIPLLLSGSRDGSAVMWGPANKGNEWDVKLRVEGPEKRFVSCTGMVRAQGEAFLLVGSSNGVLSTFILPSPTSPPPPDGSLPDAYHTLIEHKQNLCCMDTSKSGLIATGSWDKSVIIWKDFKPAVRIEEHQQAVWAVKFVGEDRILTADHSILLHQFDLASGRSKVMQRFTGHSEPVRGLSLRPDGKSFWSCANDSSINLYSFDRPAPIRSLSGHTSFVYAVASLPNGGVLSSGEDGTLRIWSGMSEQLAELKEETDEVQTIAHPCTSIWSCAVVPIPGGSGYYVASSANDGLIRVFTIDPKLQAPQDEREKWEKEVSSRALGKDQVGDVKHSDLPGMEALGREGKKEGQVLMIKNNDKVEAYQWQASNRTWQQVGTVVDAVGSGRRQLYEGQEYDYVFDVDVSEGMPPLKLPYNVSDNPWMAAQRFLDKHDLPHSYTEQVVEFISKNTDGATLGQSDGGSYVDPYTGASRYTGGTTSGGPSSGGGDPFTGGSAYSSTPAPPPPASRVLPVKTFLNFKQMNVAAAKAKITALNEEIKAKDATLALSADDEKNLREIYALLALPAAALPDTMGDGDAERFDPKGLLAVIQRWPEAQRFPLLDLARCLAPISPLFGLQTSPIALLATANWSEGGNPDKIRDTNYLLVLRALANLFSTKKGRGTMSKAAGEVLPALIGKEWAGYGKSKQAAATIALNYSILAVDNSFPIDQASTLLAFISHILNGESSDNEVIYRTAIALGNLILSRSSSGNLQVGQVQSAKARVSALAKKLGEKRLTDLASEIETLGA